jgi:hypothetical protein
MSPEILLKTLARKGRLEMRVANNALPVKLRRSSYALQKLRGAGRNNFLPTGALLAFEEAERKERA